MKKSNFLTFLLILIVGLTTGISVFAQETMTNDEVITLVQNGLNSSIVVNKIRSSKTNFDLSTDSLIKLKKAGVSDEIVNAMLSAKSGMTTTPTTTGSNNGGAMMTGDPNDPASKHGYGLYLYEETADGKKMTQLTPNVSSQNRTGGAFTASITPFGLGKVKQKANLPGRNAGLQIKDTTPVFYFYLDASTGGLNTSSGIPSNPSEFVLVRFNQRSDNREITIGKSNAYGAKGGLSDEYVVQFKAEDMGGGIYKVTPNSDLPKGEYAFYLINSGGSNASAAVGSKFFDFGVNMMP